MPGNAQMKGLIKSAHVVLESLFIVGAAHTDGERALQKLIKPISSQAGH